MKKIVLALLTLFSLESKATDPAFWFLMTAAVITPSIIVCCMPRSIKQLPSYQSYKERAIGVTAAAASWALANYRLTSDINDNDTMDLLWYNRENQISLLQETLAQLKACNCTCP